MIKSQVLLLDFLPDFLLYLKLKGSKSVGLLYFKYLKLIVFYSIMRCIMKRLEPGLNIKLLAVNVKFDLIESIKQLAKERKVSQGYLVNEIFTTYFERLRGVSYEN